MPFLDGFLEEDDPVTRVFRSGTSSSDRHKNSTSKKRGRRHKRLSRGPGLQEALQQQQKYHSPVMDNKVQQQQQQRRKLQTTFDSLHNLPSPRRLKEQQQQQKATIDLANSDSDTVDYDKDKDEKDNDVVATPSDPKVQANGKALMSQIMDKPPPPAPSDILEPIPRRKKLKTTKRSLTYVGLKQQDDEESSSDNHNKEEEEEGRRPMSQPPSPAPLQILVPAAPPANNPKHAFETMMEQQQHQNICSSLSPLRQADESFHLKHFVETIARENSSEPLSYTSPPPLAVAAAATRKQPTKKKRLFQQQQQQQQVEWQPAALKNGGMAFPKEQSTSSSPPPPDAVVELLDEDEDDEASPPMPLSPLNNIMSTAVAASSSSVQAVMSMAKSAVAQGTSAVNLTFTKKNGNTKKKQAQKGTKIDKPGSRRRRGKNDKDDEMVWGNISKPPAIKARHPTGTTDWLPTRKKPTRKGTTTTTKEKSDDDEEFEFDFDARVDPNRPITRSSSKKKPPKNEVVDLISDDEEDNVAKPLPPPNTGTFLVSRIALGQRIQRRNCVVDMEESSMKISFSKTPRRTIPTTITLEWKDLVEMWFFRSTDVPDESSAAVDAQEEELFVLIILPQPTVENALARPPWARYFLDDHSESGAYIVLDFPSEEELNGVLSCLAIRSDVEPLTTWKALEALAKPLLEDDATWASSSLLSPRSKLAAFVRGKPDEHVLLIYPFAASEQQFASLVDGLPELNRAPLPLPPSDQDSTPAPAAPGRAHTITIHVQDYKRLEPGVFLNDSIVDLWMQWIMRHKGVDASLEQVQVFSSHLFSTLQKGAGAVQNWTAKKGINLFDKKMIFLPINRSLHWSLCVVLNPGVAILAEARKEEEVFEDVADDKTCCILFFDSLKLHKPAWVRQTVHGWLNAEYKRLNKNVCIAKPFTQSSCPLYSPAVPMQDNMCDCGVFVCRYAYSLLLVRDSVWDVSERDVNPKTPFLEHITKSKEFDFGMNEIAQFRKDFAVFLERMSGLYQSLAKNSKKPAVRRLEMGQEKDEAAKEEDNTEEVEVMPKGFVQDRMVGDEANCEMKHDSDHEKEVGDTEPVSKADAPTTDEAKVVAAATSTPEASGGIESDESVVEACEVRSPPNSLVEEEEHLFSTFSQPKHSSQEMSVEI